MAQTNGKNATQAEGGNSLTDFNFDSEESWFGMDAEGGKSTDAGTVTKAVKASDKPKEATGNTIKEKAGDEEEEEEEEEHTFFADPIEKKDTVKKPPVKKTVVEEGAEEEEQEEEDVDDDDDEEEDDKKKKTKKEGVKDPKDTGKGKTEDEGGEDEPGEEDDEKFYTTLASEMTEKGIFQNVKLKKDEKVTEEKFFELQDAEVEARVTETIEALSEKMDDDGKRFLKFKANGGNTASFMSIVASPINFDKFDENDPKQVDTVLRHYLSTKEELEGDELTDKLQWLKDGGKEKAKAATYFDKLKAEKERELKKLEKQLEDDNARKEDEVKEFKEGLIEILNETEQIGVIKITKQDQRELGNYMTKPLIKVGKNKYVPEVMAELTKILTGKTKEDKKRFIALSKAIRSNFDIKDLAKDTTTKVVSKVKSKLQEAKASPKARTSGNSQTRALTDYFDS